MKVAGCAGRPAGWSPISGEETALGLVSRGRSKKRLECHTEAFSSSPTGDQGPSCDLKIEDAQCGFRQSLKHPHGQVFGKQDERAPASGTGQSRLREAQLSTERPQPVLQPHAPAACLMHFTRSTLQHIAFQVKF